MEQGKGRICSVCGTVNNENAKFCFECGNKFEEQKVCPKCGRAYEEGMKFCPQCGTSLMNQNVINENNLIGSELMADPVPFDEKGFIKKDEAKVLGSSVSREEINVITITDKMNEISDDGWDVSANKDGSVMACIKWNDNLSELIIAGRNGIKANENCSGLFARYSNVQKINFKCKFDTSWVTDMSHMFQYCELKDLDISQFDTSRVINMSYMFESCGFKELDISNFDTNRVRTMSHMFSGCIELEDLNISRFDTSQVIDMSHMFSNCSKLEDLNISGFDTSQVIDMSHMFFCVII